ncbi:RNA methyltransferase [Patulibacter sp. SYSU D01012]|uniref:TrmH family RNA methyltransferase n=1 Tax=Patulibacter sp. SYSU D01012 TaxID=2817381 RepID=UPI001B318122|nr:RNA methyltransferase [Patulibacter sp. SYSU D01012]
MAPSLDPRERRDRCITVYGRRAVLEALADPALEVAGVTVSEAGGAVVGEVSKAARAAGVELRREKPHRVSLISGNGRQDQGVVADVVAPAMEPLSERLQALARDPSRRQRLLVVDGVTTPANLGLILRSATAAGVDGVVLPRKGTAALSPQVVKASAGTAWRAPILRAADAPAALSDLTDAGFVIVGLDAGAETSLWDLELPDRVAFLVGGEHDGASAEANAYAHTWTAVPMPGDVESLNVACATTLVAFEIARRG